MSFVSYHFDSLMPIKDSVLIKFLENKDSFFVIPLLTRILPAELSSPFRSLKKKFVFVSYDPDSKMPVTNSKL